MADQYQPRVIRLFVSSVARDVQAERDYLYKFTFPRLQNLCDSRGVIVEVVDWGWGIADGDSTPEEVLELSLEELQRSRPYYIGLIGEHYGRVVENIPDELLKRWPLLAEYHGRSTTELEIVCGVLADDAMHGRGFFYFRDPKFLDNTAQGRRPDFTGQSIEDEEKLEVLKQRIRDVSQQGSTCRLGENYRNVEELGEWILADFRQLIDKLWPVAESQTEVTPGDDDVMFTVYRAATVVPQKWYSLLAFAHLSERRPDAPPDEPDPLAEVHKQAQQVLGEKMAEYRQSSQDSSSSVPHAGEITFKPFVEGFDFNPSSRSFRWEESVHREEFKMRAVTTSDGEVAKGWLRVYLGPLILAQINLSIKVDSRSVAHSERQAPAVESARPLRRVFASYSHKDRAIVERIEEVVSQTHLGIEYLRDATNLRVGEEWSPRLMEMIREAQAFQLFWSTNSMRSDFVRQEYQYALSLGREHFVLPVYWETPFPEKPEEGLPPDELRRLHFENLSGSTPTSHYSAPDPTASESIEPPSAFQDTAELVGEEFLAAADPITMELAQPNDAAVSDAPTDQLEEPPVPFPGHASEPAFCPQCGTEVRRLAKFCARCGVLLQTPGESTLSGVLPQPLHSPEEDLASSRDYPGGGDTKPTPSLAGGGDTKPTPTLAGGGDTLRQEPKIEARPVEFDTQPHASITRAAPPPADSVAYGRGYAYTAEAPPLPAVKKSYGALILGLGAVAFGFLIFVPVAFVAIGTVTAGSSGSSGGGALFLLLFLFFIAGLLVIGGGAAAVVLLLKRRR